QHVVAFARVAGNKRVIAVAPRLVAGLCGFNATVPTGPSIWRDTEVPVPIHSGDRGYRNIFTGEEVSVTGAGARAGLRVAELFSVLPVALLVNETEVSQ
ncbi:MAG: hypothetical protein ACRD4Y_06705, partial [Candidatus Acidiferrales bacterium]